MKITDYGKQILGVGHNHYRGEAMWKIIECAVQGRSHIKTEIPCQDKTYTCVQNGVSVITLADGAGSATMSHYGAECVTKFTCNELVGKFDEYYNEPDGVLAKKRLVDGMLHQLEELAISLCCEVKNLASTLLVVAVKEDKFILGHIGDGVVGYLKNDELKVASLPENGEFANTTIFTTSKDALMTMKIMKGTIGSIQGFVIMSDGTEASLYNKKEKRLAEVIKKVMLFSTIIPTEKVQEQLKKSFESVICQATTDDCSIAIMTNDYDSFTGYEKLDLDKKCELLQIRKNSKCKKKQLKKYENLLILLKTERSLLSVSRSIYLKPKYTKKYLEKLLEYNLIEKHGEKYQTIIIMN